MTCSCMGAEMPECHEVCMFAGHGGGVCEQCDTDGMHESMCGARSRLSVPRKRESYFICTNDADHDEERHTACDGQGHVLARWRSDTSPIEVWTPLGKVWV